MGTETARQRLRPSGDGGWGVGACWHAAVMGRQASGWCGVALAEGKSFPWESFQPCVGGSLQARRPNLG